MNVISPSSGSAFLLKRGQVLTVLDPQGEQVADLLAFSSADPREAISSGRTLDYLSKLCPTTGDAIYSNRSNKMLQIVSDAVGCHDFLLTPCSAETFRLLYAEGTAPLRGCFENLRDALAEFGIVADCLPTAFNIFMNVQVGPDGSLTVAKPLSRAGDRIEFVALMDLIIGLTACSAPMSNNGSMKPIHYMISDQAGV
jgi:uncharacterized protein